MGVENQIIGAEQSGYTNHNCKKATTQKAKYNDKKVKRCLFFLFVQNDTTYNAMNHGIVDVLRILVQLQLYIYLQKRTDCGFVPCLHFLLRMFRAVATHLTSCSWDL